ncbi:hypothetical protein D3C72_323380 [compost metagenome]
MYDVLLHQPTAFFQDRKVVNTVYLLVPPIGLLMMFLSPFYSTRERMVRTVMTASFIAFFAVMGPDLRAYLAAQVAALAV